MKAILCLLALAGLLITTGCRIEGPGVGGYVGPTEYHYGYYHHGYWDNGRGGYWDRGRYYYY